MSGCDADLRRRVIENIVAGCTGKRVVVVTASGISSTLEQDGKGGDEAGGETTETESTAEPVNGVADDSSIETQSTKSLQHATENLEGWLSCSSYEEMAEVLAKLAASRDYDYIVTEGATSNSIGPQQIASVFQEKGGASLRVDTLVSVLDSDSVLDELHTNQGDASASDAANTGPDKTDVASERQVEEGAARTGEVPLRDQSSSRPMLIVNLVENANVIVLNQEEGDLSGARLEPIQSLLSVLNRRASIVPAKACSIPVQELVNTNMYDAEDLSLSASWKQVLMAARVGQGNSPRAIPKSLKDSTFVYRARRPFHPQRLFKHIRDVQTFSGVIRSTGKIWLATRMLAPLEWNQAGDSATLQLGSRFWAARSEDEWPKEENLRAMITENWDNQYGDRETELVFVGMGVDKDRLQGLLDGCLLQDEEMVFTNLWENFEDPFIEWVPLMEDLVLEEDEEEEQVKRAEPEPQVATNAEEEGVVSEVPDEVVEKASALDALVMDDTDESDVSRLPLPVDNGQFDEDSVVLSSGEGSVADGILRQIPKVGLPVTILTGFLGSGKTTVLNYILKAPHGLRIAVLVNEFGEIDIDSQLVENSDWSDDEIMELSNGCICCSINDSFVNAVQKVLDRRDTFDYLVVETTGLADPGPVLNSLVASEVAEEVRVDGVLTVVDADGIANSSYKDSEVAKSQISAADTILLSKTDIASEETIDEAIAYIQSIRPAARILRSQRGRVPLGMILDVGIRVVDGGSLNEQEKAAHDHQQDHEHGHEHGHDHSHEHSHDHGHDHEHGERCGPDCNDPSHSHSHNHFEVEGFTTTSFKSDMPLVPAYFMSKFLQRLPNEVFRAKGLLHFEDYPKRIIFQLSGRRYSFEEDEWPKDQVPGNQLVIIGRGLDTDELHQTLEECHANNGNVVEDM